MPKSKPKKKKRVSKPKPSSNSWLTVWKKHQNTAELIISAGLKLFTGVLFVATVLTLISIHPSVPYSFALIKSGSMSPAIRTGAAVVYWPQESYEQDQIIVFNKPQSEDNLVTVHRIIEVLEPVEASQPYSFKTMGDANPSEDFFPVAQPSIRGKVVLTIPLIGYLAGSAQQVVFTVAALAAIYLYHVLFSKYLKRKIKAKS